MILSEIPYTWSRYLTISTLSFLAALWSGISFSSSVDVIFAPSLTRNFTMSKLFFTVAMCKGLRPERGWYKMLKTIEETNLETKCFFVLYIVSYYLCFWQCWHQLPSVPRPYMLGSSLHWLPSAVEFLQTHFEGSKDGISRNPLSERNFPLDAWSRDLWSKYFIIN